MISQDLHLACCYIDRGNRSECGCLPDCGGQCDCPRRCRAGIFQSKLENSKKSHRGILVPSTLRLRVRRGEGTQYLA
jgi:hypothetical protein